ncbi:CBS domain-containing protein [Bacillus sp. ISL-47]|uniref:cyclic di-AMP binding protein CbpA n=1 Tax=Bacillus sp. ISL-47 TaxID=2819130 RepID=UPI001BE593EE|nr:cyclic di-AMP binding protein CbpA [Bacillus sp. ISL-47]MBT2690199.1 CBS domain-containing protein [Bacillus sp. ISL-47]MBT2710352.1 CBS domain-containing protein [Pseudomonas sp. ISL-84]
MLIRHQMVEKTDVRYCDETFNLEKALQFLNKTGYRCVPILDQTHTKFIGNIYKVDILEYKENHSLDEAITALATDQETVIDENDSFMKAFFTLKRFPYLPVVNKNDKFVGLLTHAAVLELLEEAWGLNRGSYTLTVGSYGTQGTLKKMTSIISKHSDIQGVISLDSSNFHVSLIRRVLFTLPKDTTKATLDKIKKEMDQNGFRVIGVECHDGKC